MREAHTQCPLARPRGRLARARIRDCRTRDGITIIGIPFAAQAVKLAGYALWPFGRSLVPSATRDKGLSVVANVLWFVLVGWWLALEHLIVGILLCTTVIGIPLGVGSFKMAGAALVPFGKEVVELRTLAKPPEDAVVIGAETDR